MRTLRNNNNNDEINLTEQQYIELSQKVNQLQRDVYDLSQEISLQETELDNYKSDNLIGINTGTIHSNNINNSITINTNEINSSNGNINNLETDSINNSGLIETDRIKARALQATDIIQGADGYFTGELQADNITANSLNVNEYNIEEAEIADATITDAAVEDATITNATITNATIDEANITEIESSDIQTSNLGAEQITVNNASIDKLVSGSIVNSVETYDNIPTVNNEPVWIEVPIVNTGSYKLHVVSPINEYYFGINISYAGNNNATIQYDELSWSEYPDYLGNTIHLFDNKLYFECCQPSSKIYWKFESSTGLGSEIVPTTYGYLPIDASQAEHFIVKNKSGTIFTRYVQIGENGEGVLTLSPTSWLESTDEPVQYDPSQNVNFGFYAPDQDLDKGSSPEFHSIKLDTEGKTVVRATEEGVVYTQEEASVDNGTLIPEPKLIEADELYEYNGNSYDIITRTTPGDWIILPSEVNPMKAETNAEDVNGYFWHYENEGGWSEVTNNRLFEYSEYRQVFAWPTNNSTGLLGFDLSGYTLDGTEEIPGYGDYKLHTGDRFAIKICSDVWNSNSCTRTYKLDPTVRGNAISESYTGDWFAHSTSKNYLMKNIYASGDSRNATSTFTNEGSETGLNLNFTNAFSLVNSFYNKLAGTSNLNNFCIIKQGNNYFITKSRSASWSFTQKVVSCFNGVYTSLNAAIDAFFNQTYSGTQSVTLTSNVDWFYPMLLGEDCNVGSGQVCTPLTAYRYKRVVQNNIKRFVDDTATPLDSHFANTSTNNSYYIQRNDGKWALIASINTSYTTVVTIGEPYGIKANTVAGTPTTVYYTLTYDSNGIFNFGTYDSNVITPPATLNKLYEVVKVPKGDVEYMAVTETTIDYTSTGHPITNLGDNTVVYGRATVGTDLTVNRDTVLGNDEGTIDPDTGDPIHTNTEVKGDVTVGTTASNSFTAKSIAYFENGYEVGSVQEPRHAHHYGGIYRYNFDTNVDEEINSTYQRVDEKGVANGYAPLDNNARIPRQHMPYDVMEYRGSWDASTGVFPQGTAQDPLQIGDTYKVSVAGTIDGQYYGVNDEITYNGSTWDYYENNKVILGTTDLGVVGCLFLG